jgi:valyl-tRNA synthetase
MPLEQDLEECLRGNHKLKVIYESGEYYRATQVIRWCEVCGSVVIDVETDGRTIPGKVMPMKIPAIFRRD